MKMTDLYLYAILAVFVFGIVVSLWKLQKAENDFNLLDVLMENGRVSRIASAFAVTLVITSWVIVKLAVDGKMTEGYLMTYGGMWVAPVITKMFATNVPVQKEN